MNILPPTPAHRDLPWFLPIPVTWVSFHSSHTHTPIHTRSILVSFSISDSLKQSGNRVVWDHFLTPFAFKTLPKLVTSASVFHDLDSI